MKNIAGYHISAVLLPSNLEPNVAAEQEQPAPRWQNPVQDFRIPEPNTSLQPYAGWCVEATSAKSQGSESRLLRPRGQSEK